MTKRIFLLNDGPLAPQDQVKVIAEMLENDIRQTIRQHFKQKAHIDEIKRLCHVPTGET